MYSIISVNYHTIIFNIEQYKILYDIMKIDIVIRNIVLKNNTSNKNTNSESKSINHSQITLIENLTIVNIYRKSYQFHTFVFPSKRRTRTIQFETLSGNPSLHALSLLIRHTIRE